MKGRKVKFSNDIKVIFDARLISVFVQSGINDMFMFINNKLKFCSTVPHYKLIGITNNDCNQEHHTKNEIKVSRRFNK